MNKRSPRLMDAESKKDSTRAFSRGLLACPPSSHVQFDLQVDTLLVSVLAKTNWQDEAPQAGLSPTSLRGHGTLCQERHIVRTFLPFTVFHFVRPEKDFRSRNLHRWNPVTWNRLSLWHRWSAEDEQVDFQGFGNFRLSEKTAPN